MLLAQGHNAMLPVRLEPAATRSRVKHSRSHDIVLVSSFFKLPQERCDKVSWPSHHGQSSEIGDVEQQNKQNTNIPASTKIAARTKFAAGTKIPARRTKFAASTKFAAGTKIPASTKFAASTKISAGTNEPWHEITNNVVSATCKGSDQPAHTRRLIRVFACRLIIIWVLSYWSNLISFSKLNRRLHRFVWVYTCQNGTLLEITCLVSNIPEYRAA